MRHRLATWVLQGLLVLAVLLILFLQVIGLPWLGGEVARDFSAQPRQADHLEEEDQQHGQDEQSLEHPGGESMSHGSSVERDRSNVNRFLLPRRRTAPDTAKPPLE